MHPGTLVAGGKYRVEKVLGRGGMGIVVEASHAHLGHRVALKFLDPDLVREPTAKARFLREAKACALLKGDHVCRVSDFGVDEQNVPFIVMELLEGADLAKLVRSRPLDIATAAQYVIQACAGVAEAHALQIVHRDLKPGNLFVVKRADGRAIVKVVDFGVAKVLDGDVGLTGTQGVVGSPGFMAPEQIRSSRSVDGRADIWSLGVILYKLVSGRVPFAADSFAEFALAIVKGDPPPLVEAPPAFAAIVWKCLEKDPDARYQTVGELAAALAPYATGVHAAMTIQGPAPAVASTTGTLLGTPTPTVPAASSSASLAASAVAPPSPSTTQRETKYTDAVATPPPVDELPPGMMVGEYRIERKIGEGGMGAVYSALHPLIGKKAAIKVIGAALGADADAVQRFVQEARAVNQIGHPNIVDVFAFGVLPDGRNYFVMEHLAGESLRERLARQTITLGDALEILDEVAAALEAAHDKGIVHRDLKPDNIYLAQVRAGGKGARIVVKLLDFGIAKLAVPEAAGAGSSSPIAKTRTGMLMGTPAYLSPEQARGTNVSYATDIYALGCLLYEICTGRLPFVAASAMDVVLMHTREPVTPPRTWWPQIPARLDALIERMLAKDPAARPSLVEVRGVFTDLVTSGEVIIAQGTGTYRSDLRARRASEMPTPKPTPKPSALATVVEPVPPLMTANIEVPPEPPTPARLKPLWIAIGVVGAIAIGALVFTLVGSHDAKVPPIDAPAQVHVVAPPPIAIDAAPPPIAIDAPPPPPPIDAPPPPIDAAPHIHHATPPPPPHHGSGSAAAKGSGMSDGTIDPFAP